MAPVSFLHILLLALAAQLSCVAAASSHADAGIAQEGVQVPMIPKYMENLTEAATFHPKGWYTPNICEGKWCLYSSREVGSGRGLVVITSQDNFQKIRRLEVFMNKIQSTPGPGAPGVPFEEREVASSSKSDSDAGLSFELVATQPLKRGTRLMELTPVVMAHKTFLNETDRAAQDHLLEAALALLPDETRKLARAGMAKSRHASARRSLRDALLLHPMETGTGSTHWDGPDHGRHHALYPEVLAARHECRANAAWHVGPNHELHLTMARRTAVGEPLALSYLNPTLVRAERAEAARQLWGAPCTCDHCTSGGDLDAVRARDGRQAELAALERELKDMDSRRVTTGMLEHYVALLGRDNLHARMAEAYELVAYNYAYLGFEKQARKYGALAVQAAVIEQGPDSNDVTALRVFANSVTEHYSWQRKVKKKQG
ncbi:hypothetical protein RB595_004297 [Gaeumannomyces hyphopodioides]